MAINNPDDDNRITLAHAMHLCADKNLIWSSDFDAIRPWLATYLQFALVTKPINQRDVLLAKRIIGLQGADEALPLPPKTRENTRPNWTGF